MRYLFLSITLLLLSTSSSLLADTYDSSGSVFLFQKQMAKRGNAVSQFKLGLMYETGSGVTQSQVLATSWYKKAERQDYKPATNRLTYLEIKKTGFNVTYTNWLKGLQSDARFNEGEALFLLGQMYSEGVGVNKSLTRSLTLLRKAAGGNIPGADAEIARVEAELNQLQQQYISKDEKAKTKAAAISAVKKATQKPRKPKRTTSLARLKKTASSRVNKTKKTPLKNIKNASKSVTAQSTLKNNISTVKQKPLNVSAAPVASPAKTKNISAKPEIEKEEEHPMDTICGGRNRFSRGCR